MYVSLSAARSLACESPLDARVKSALLADTLTLVGLPAVPAPADRSTSLKMRIGAVSTCHLYETPTLKMLSLFLTVIKKNFNKLIL